MGSRDTPGLSVPVRRRTIHPPPRPFGQDRTGCGMPPGGARPPGRRHAAFPAERKAGAACHKARFPPLRKRPQPAPPARDFSPWPNERSRWSFAPVSWAGG